MMQWAKKERIKYEISLRNNVNNLAIQEMVIQDGCIVKIKLIIGNKEVEVTR